ncbi:MAG: peptidylprolyl isomerase [Bacteroidota bacterium]|nr:peptidylprolyl isomerase [Bacteroidota bacterium]
MNSVKKIIAALVVMLVSLTAHAQQPGMVVDRIVGVIGNQIVKESEVQNAYEQYKTAGISVTDTVTSAVFDQLMFKKLLVSQAIHDSIDVSEAEITGETDRRMRYFLTQFKSDKEFEAFYGKTVDAFKFELHDQVKELLLAQKMQGTITADVSVSPAEVQEFFNRQIPDSLPYINAEVELGQIVIVPPVNQELKEYTRASLEEIRQRVLKGTLKFCDAVNIYSEDPGSRPNCGTYENVRRGTFVPEFDAVSYSLKEGETSEVFETDYGFHFVQLLSRKGEEVSIRHILKTVPSSPEDLKKCKSKLDSIIALIRKDSMNFCQAAARFSMDDDTKYNCGLFMNPETGITRIDVDLLGQLDPDPQFPLMINQMKVGSMSSPQPTVTRDGKQGYRILMLRSRSEPHRANLKDDYQLIQDMALQEKQNNAIVAWVKKRLETTYVRIDPAYQNYHYAYPWLAYIK